MQRVQVDPLEFIITTRDDPTPRTILFEKINQIRDDVVSMTLLWNQNCYHVNVSKKYFIINGGRRINAPGFDECEDARLLYCKRNSLSYTLNKGDDGKGPKHEISYILGLEGTVYGENKQLMVHIGPDGRQWLWKDRR